MEHARRIGIHRIKDGLVFETSIRQIGRNLGFIMFNDILHIRVVFHADPKILEGR